MSEEKEVTMEKLIADFKIIIDDAEQLIGATASQAGERVVELRQHLVTRVEEVKASLAQREKELREAAERLKSRVTARLPEENWSRLVLVVGLGVLAGLALRCRKSNSHPSGS